MIQELLVKSVMLSRRGWTVRFGQKCTHCGTPNTIEIYEDTIVCGRCEQVFTMDNPKLQASGGRQIGSAKWSYTRSCREYTILHGSI